MWTLVPPNPNELTPARGGAASAGQGSSWVGTRRAIWSKGMYGLGVSKCRLGGIWPWRSASAALSRPAIPAAASGWPMLDLIEPTAQRSPAARPAPTTAASDFISIGSPSRVPLPCASTYCTEAGDTPASR